MRLSGFLLSAILLASCSSVREFEIRVIDKDEQPVKALIVVDRQWPQASEDPLYSDNVIEVEFERQIVNVRVWPVQYDEGSGEILKVPQEGDPAPYFTKHRDLRIGDPRVQLFILAEDLEYDIRLRAPFP